MPRPCTDSHLSIRELNHLSHFEFSGRRKEGDVTASLGYSKSLGNWPRGKESEMTSMSLIHLLHEGSSFTLSVN